MEENDTDIQEIIKDISTILQNLDWNNGGGRASSGLCTSIVENQSNTLKLLKSHLGYLKQNHRSMRFIEDLEGNIIEGKLCECTPEIVQDKNVSLSVTLQRLGFQCPTDYVSKSHGTTIFNIDCPGGICPRIVNEECEPELR